MSTTVADKKAKQDKDEPLDERITFMAAKSWKERIENAARAQGMSFSAYLRWAALQQSKRDQREEEG